jgi:hypothetical protein
MRKLIVAIVCALGAGLVFAVPALAEHDESERVCRGFAVYGILQEIGDRTLVVAAEKARPDGLAGSNVELRVGSRTRFDGADSVAVGSHVKAHGTVCQVDEADAPVYYTKRVKVKKPKVERPRGSFKLAGVVTEVSDASVVVEVAESNVASLVGKKVTILIGDGTAVDGELAPGAEVLIAGKARIVDGAPALLASEIAITGGGGEEGGEGGDGSEPAPDGEGE